MITFSQWTWRTFAPCPSACDACDACDALDEWKYETSRRRDKTRLNRSRSGAIPRGPRRYRPYPRNQWVRALHEEARQGGVQPNRGRSSRRFVDGGLHELKPKKLMWRSFFFAQASTDLDLFFVAPPPPPSPFSVCSSWGPRRAAGALGPPPPAGGGDSPTPTSYLGCTASVAMVADALEARSPQLMSSSVQAPCGA